MKAAQELKALAPEQRRERLQELRQELMKLNVQVASGNSSASPGKIRQVKKNIARILTIGEGMKQ